MCGNHLPKSKGKIKGEVIDPFVVAEVFDAPFPRFSGPTNSSSLVTTTATSSSTSANPIANPASSSGSVSRPIPMPTSLTRPVLGTQTGGNSTGTTPSVTEGSQWSSPSVPVGASSSVGSNTQGDGPTLSEQATFTYRTATVQNNGWNPSWNETFAIRIVNLDLAMIRFTVYDSDLGSNEYVGSFAASVKSLRQGYRHLYLRNWKGKLSSDATLLVHITLNG